MSGRIRVLVVDDSAFARKVLRDTLIADARFDVVGIARDGLEALERIAELKPDVMTLDLVMPNLDGIGVLKALPAVGAPRVVVVSMADGESEIGVEALRLGAVELVHKPTSLASDQLYELAGELMQKVATAAAARPLPPESVRHTPVPASRIVTARKRLLLIGASTGGPQALTRVLRRLPGDLPVPVAIVLHMPPGYTAAFAQRLDEECALEVVEAEDGMALGVGRVMIARAGIHLRLREVGGAFRAMLDARPVAVPHRPSVDVLFESALGVGAGVLAVVLTGMGDDGARQALALHQAGAHVLTEAESTCVVYGMPRAVVELGASSGSHPIDAMADAIVSAL